MSNKVNNLNGLFKQAFDDKLFELIRDEPFVKNLRSTEGWLKCEISEQDEKKYENARKALEIKNTKLWKVLA